MINNKWKYLIGITATVIIIFIIFIFVIPKKSMDQNGVVMTVNGIQVTREEFQLVLDSFRSKVKSEYSTEIANDPDFWCIEDSEGTTPVDKLVELTVQDLTEKKVITWMAKKQKLDMGTDFESIKKEFEEDQKKREEREDQETAVYGPDGLSLQSFYNYSYTMLSSELEEALKEKYPVGEEILQNLYEERQSELTYQVEVTMQICEIGPELADYTGDITDAMKVKSLEELQTEYPEAGFYELTMNDLDTQEGKSGVYRMRWEYASLMQEGEICEPFTIGDHVLIMKCLHRSENGVLDFESVKGILKSQYQSQVVYQEMQKAVAEADVVYEQDELVDEALKYQKE